MLRLELTRMKHNSNNSISFDNFKHEVQILKPELKFNEKGEALVEEKNPPRELRGGAGFSYHQSYNFLLDQGESLIHPRTRERIVGVKKRKVKAYVKRLAVAYHREKNRPRGRIFKPQLKKWLSRIGLTLKDATIMSIGKTVVGKTVPTWKTVWYTGSNIKLGVGGSRRK